MKILTKLSITRQTSKFNKDITTEETKVCRKCGKELPMSAFQKNRWGTNSICKECTKAVRQANTIRQTRMRKNAYSDEMFDGKTPREVQEILARAAKWLNNCDGFTCKIELTYEKKINLDIR